MGDGWRLSIRHQTGFRYEGRVTSSYNEARMSPRNEPRQRLLSSELAVTPTITDTYQYQDYWGTTVTAFDLHEPHDALEVTAISVVETMPADDPAGECTWEALSAPMVTDRWHELLVPTSRTSLDDELREIAATTRRTQPDPNRAAMAICELVRDEVAYQPGATEVITDAAHAWRQRAGVCQDLSHLVVGLLRATGVPARYVSGYLHPSPDTELGEPVVGQSHAWVEWWDGQWTAWDPTNGVAAGVGHVVVGRGRDYGDVPPLKGIFSGPAQAGQRVEVELTRLA